MNDFVVVIGGGLAGLSAALALAPIPVILVSAAPLGEQASSGWAQGGIAAAVGADDAPALHAADTRAAGDGLCDPATVARIIDAGPALIGALSDAGVRFDHETDGTVALGLEAAHGRRRIVHAGDSTGREVMRALIARVRATPSIRLVCGTARRLLLRDGEIAGVALEDGSVLAARRVVLATGGLGALYRDTTNPRLCWGQGLLLAARAGAVLTDMEFVQFHPTALAGGRDPMPLVSEAVRGEGAVLIDESGVRFMQGRGRAELEPRDVVARAVSAHLARGHRVFLDAREALGAEFVRHFPAITESCADAGIDPATQPIPVRPAAHYHMGGVAVTQGGRSSVAGLYACGECAGTGLHGANRLASNSLLEAAVTGQEVAAAIRFDGVPAARDLAAVPAWAPADPTEVRDIMSAGLGVLRDDNGMCAAAAALLRLAEGAGPAADPATVGLAVGVSALRRAESRGAHARTDYPALLARALRSRITLDETFAAARALDCVVA
jgi:L-aspartate oxidase